MHLEWLHGDVRARCPLCDAGGPQAAILSIDHVVPGWPRVTLVRCAGCGAAFLEDLTPPDYGEGIGGAMLDYYVEQGAGIDIMVAPLLRLRPEAIRRCLEVGCSFGFALDFARHAFGWEVRGVDPSPLAAAGGEALGLPITHAYFTADLDLGGEPFDVVLCSEILEHLDRPHALLTAIRERLAPAGLLILSTPNLAVVRQDAEEGDLHRALSPGLHLVLYDAGALTRLLTAAGFTALRIEESPATLVAFAALSPEALVGVGPAARDAHPIVLRDYYAARAAAVPPGSALASGFAYRHFKETINAGCHEEAVASRDRLAAVYRERYGLDFAAPEEIAALLRTGWAQASAERALPFNLTGALFFAGIHELNHFRRRERAAAYFAASVAVGGAMLAAQQPYGLYDGETEALLNQSRKHLPLTLAGPHPRRLAARAAAFGARARRAMALPPAELRARLAQAVSRRLRPGARLRTAYGIEAFWCDPHGIYLSGWAHAYEDRVHRLRLDAAGRHATVESLSDRPDLLAFHPDNPHVRHSGFAVYLACPAGHSVRMTLETSGGVVSFPLPLPERPLPAWPAVAGAEEEVSPLLRRFAGLANEGGGRVLQIGARGLPASCGGVADPARGLLHGPVVGLDIHPGPHVDVVGDAHFLSRFFRAGCMDAVFSASVLEHLQAPWLLAAEVNRVLRPGGLAYHEAPGAWPAHAQPNDFWRMSAAGLCALFGPESGFEVLEARDDGPATLHPGPEWRSRHLAMPTLPVYAMAEILVRKVREIPPGAVAWPLPPGAGAERARRYPLSGVARGGLC